MQSEATCLAYLRYMLSETPKGDFEESSFYVDQRYVLDKSLDCLPVPVLRGAIEETWTLVLRIHSATL